MSTANAVEDHGLTVHFKDELAYSADEQSSRAIGDAVDPARIVPTNTPLTHTLPEATGQPGAYTLFPGIASTNTPLTQKQTLPEATGQSVTGSLFSTDGVDPVRIVPANTPLAHTEILTDATVQSVTGSLFSTDGVDPARIALTNIPLAHTLTEVTGQPGDALFPSEADASYQIYQFNNLPVLLTTGVEPWLRKLSIF